MNGCENDSFVLKKTKYAFNLLSRMKKGKKLKKNVANDSISRIPDRDPNANNILFIFLLQNTPNKENDFHFDPIHFGFLLAISCIFRISFIRSLIFPYSSVYCEFELYRIFVISFKIHRRHFHGCVDSTA